MSLLLLKRLALGLLVGGALGFAYQKFIGCRTGTCPLMATPFRGILYGASVGLVWALLGRARP
jgi:gas vesicle protein